MTPDDPNEMNPDTPDRPIEAARYAWPTVELDPVDQMRILAAGLPHAAANETVFDANFDRVWSFIADLEQNTARFEASVSRIKILERSGDRIVLDAKGPLSVASPWIRFDVVLRPGWCLMRSRLGEVGMAARPEDEERTRFFHFEGSALLGRVIKPLFAWNIRRDFVKLRKLI